MGDGRLYGRRPARSAASTAVLCGFLGNEMDDKKLIGYKDGLAVFASDALLAEKGERVVKEALGMVRRYPVQTDLSGNVVMVEGDSHEDTVRRYLTRTVKPHNVQGNRRCAALSRSVQRPKGARLTAGLATARDCGNNTWVICHPRELCGECLNAFRCDNH
jgi:hypothetical protein